MKKFNFDKMENEEKEQEQNLEDIEYAKLEGGIIQALAERERILGIIDEYNLGGQLDGIIEQIKMEPQTIKITPQNRNIQDIGKEIGDSHNNEYAESIEELLTKGVIEEEAKETCCVCGESAEFKCRYCGNYYCDKHYQTVYLTGNCCSNNEKDYEY